MWSSIGDPLFCLWVSKVFQGRPCGLLDLIIAHCAINSFIKIPIKSNDKEYNCPPVLSNIYHTLTHLLKHLPRSL